jgi:hypothetical protein
VFFVSDEAPQPGVVAPSSGAGVSTSLVVQVADVDNFIDRAVVGGAVLVRGNCVRCLEATMASLLRDQRW